MVLAVSCWLLRILCLYLQMLWWFKFPVFFHPFSYNRCATFACVVGSEAIWSEGDLNTVKQQWKPTDSTCLDGGYSWSRMFIIYFRLSFKWKYFLKCLYSIFRLPFFSRRICDLLSGKHCFSKYFSDHYLGVQDSKMGKQNINRKKGRNLALLNVMRDTLTANYK